MHQFSVECIEDGVKKEDALSHADVKRGDLFGAKKAGFAQTDALVPSWVSLFICRSNYEACYDDASEAVEA
ncbi:hypothetical protein CEXT_688201 [Caerostris extrusa]|uniref:Uncharacterized protein n=1 Tax=Caerostris extrusa TaxID=172846 RepID=A0AAV4VDX8_CAEEX|nr:hypothetical protein CEXT_688201 [Caerostris extrusa]